MTTHRRVYIETAKTDTTGTPYDTWNGGTGYEWSLCGDNDADALNLGYPARFSLGEEFDLWVASMDYSSEPFAASEGSAFTHKAWRGHETVLKVHVDGDTAAAADTAVSAFTSWLHAKVGVETTIKLFGFFGAYTGAADYVFPHNLFIKVIRSDDSIRYLPCSVQVERVTVPDAHTNRRTMYLRVRAEQPYWWGHVLDMTEAYYGDNDDWSFGATADGDEADTITPTGDVPAPVAYYMFLNGGNWGTALEIQNNRTGQSLIFDTNVTDDSIYINTAPTNPTVEAYSSDVFHWLKPESGWWDTDGLYVSIVTPGATSADRHVRLLSPRWYWGW